jgi:hypothetical protein
MRIIKSKKQTHQSTSYLKVLADQAREQRIRYRKPSAS